MTENNIYTLARALQQTDGLEQDLSRMLSSLKGTIESEYLQKIRTAAREEKACSVAHPPREVTLLHALSAFADEKGRMQIDRMAQSLLFLHTLQQVRQNVQELSSADLLAARSADGLSAEEMPSARFVKLAGLFMTLALTEGL